eukprot:TRINITY_DN3097_c0_g1_i1.p2 TRINITY_DN3097_c0_g1~~TRINITY_DN3097_c0_g1_i1.p2  ORF type:complete len:244 (-),score=38.95 TRINITY_DN3097_c0_g1_i1:262-993(-)
MEALRGLPAAVAPATRDAAVGAVRAVMATGVGLPALLAAAKDIIVPTVRSFAAQSVGVPAASGAAGPSSGAPPPPSAAAIDALVASLGAQLGPLLGDGPAATVGGAAGVVARDPAAVAFLEVLREEDIVRGGAADGGRHRPRRRRRRRRQRQRRRGRRRRRRRRRAPWSSPRRCCSPARRVRPWPPCSAPCPPLACWWRGMWPPPGRRATMGRPRLARWRACSEILSWTCSCRGCMTTSRPHR